MFTSVQFSPKSVHGTAECVAVHKDFLFLGTREGKIIAYNTSQCNDNVDDIRMTNVFTTTRKLAVRSLHIVEEKNILVVLAGDSVMTYNFRNVTQTTGGSTVAAAGDVSRVQQQPIQILDGLKDIVSLHIKKQKGHFSMAALMSKRIAFFDFDEATWRCTSPKSGFTLPDAATGFVWTGRNAILQLRRTGAVALTVRTGETEVLPIPHQGSLSLVELDPFSELLACDGKGGQRVFPNGAPVPDIRALAWSNGAPSLVLYAHPFLVSVDLPATQLQVRLPLLSLPLSSSGSDGASTLDTIASSANIVKLSAKNYTNFDNIPDVTTQTTKVAFINARNVIHLLIRRPMTSIVAALLGGKKCAEALLLSQLCASEVDEKVAHQVLVQSAVDEFVHHQYTAALQHLRSCHADPFVALTLFSDLVPSGLWDTGTFIKESGNFFSYTLEGKQPYGKDALSPLVDYLNYVRRAVENGRETFPIYNKEALLPVVYMTLTQLCVRLLREEELGDILHEVKDKSLKRSIFDFLRREGQWTALVNLFYRFEMHVDALNMLSSLALSGRWEGQLSEGGAPPALPRVGDDKKDSGLHDALARLSESSLAPPSTKAIAPQQVRDLLVKGATAAPSEPLTLRVTGVLNALGYLRSLSLKSSNDRVLFKAHISWLLGLIPVEWISFIFLAQHNKNQFSEVLHVLSCYDEKVMQQNLKSEVVVAYLSAVINDHQCKDAQIHNAYWRNTSVLLFRGPLPPSLSSERKARMHQSLDLFLNRTPYADLHAAQAFFEEPDLRTVCVAERGIIYRRLKLHREAFNMFLSEERNAEHAKEYARLAQQGGDGTAYGVLLQYVSSESVEQPINVMDLLPALKNCDGIDALSLLSYLPDTTPYHDIAALLLKSLRFKTSCAQHNEVDTGTLKLYNANTMVEKTGLSSRKIIIDAESCCAVCAKRLRADTTFLYFPSGVLVHEACAKDEHVCPLSGADFRVGLNAFLKHC